MSVKNSRLAGRRFSSLLNEVKDSADPPGIPLYIYYLTSTYDSAIVCVFRGGAQGFWSLILDDLVAAVGDMTFNAAAQWNAGGTQRSGWIYTVGSSVILPSVMFYADFLEATGYPLYETTLPYTPGQAPTVVAGTQGTMQRWVAGAG